MGIRLRKISIFFLLMCVSLSLFYLSRSRFSEKHLSQVTLYCLKQKSKPLCQYQDLRNKKLANREIKNIWLTRGFWRGAFLSHITISHSDFRQNDYSRAFFYKVSFINTKMFKSSFYGSRFHHVLFQNSRVGGSVFNFADFKNVHFKNMDLRSALFLGAHFENTWYDQKTQLPFSHEWAKKVGLLRKL